EMRDRADVARDAAVDAAVERVADDRMADRAQVDADLVRAAGVDGDARERQYPAEVLGAHDPRHRLTAPPQPRRLRRHLLPGPGIASDRRVDAPAGHHFAPDQRGIFLLDLALAKLPRQLVVRAVVLLVAHQA